MKDRINRLALLLRNSSPKKTLAIAALLIVAAALPLTVFVAQQQQNTKQEAATIVKEFGPMHTCNILPAPATGPQTYDCPSTWCISNPLGTLYAQFAGCFAGTGTHVVNSGNRHCYYNDKQPPGSQAAVSVCGSAAPPTTSTCTSDCSSIGTTRCNVTTPQTCVATGECLRWTNTGGTCSTTTPNTTAPKPVVNTNPPPIQGGSPVSTACVAGQYHCVGNTLYGCHRGHGWDDISKLGSGVNCADPARGSQVCKATSSTTASCVNSTTTGATCNTTNCPLPKTCVNNACTTPSATTCDTTNCFFPNTCVNNLCQTPSGIIKRGPVAPCAFPTHPDWSCGAANAHDVNVYWHKVADVLLNGQCPDPRALNDSLGGAGCENASPEYNLSSNVYAGTVTALQLTKDQVAKLKYNSPELQTFINGVPACVLANTLGIMANHYSSPTSTGFGSYAGSRADLEAAMQTVLNGYVTKRRAEYIAGGATPPSDAAIKAALFDSTRITGGKDPVNPSGFVPVDVIPNSGFWKPGDPTPTMAEGGASCTQVPGGPGAPGSGQTPPGGGGGSTLTLPPNPGGGGTCGGQICNGLCVLNVCFGGGGGPTVTPGPAGNTKLAITVGLDGIGSSGDHQNPLSGGNPSPKTPVRNITVQIYDTNNNLVDTRDENITYIPSAGIFKGTVSLKQGFTTGSYRVLVKSPRYLRRALGGIQTITADTTNTIPSSSTVSTLTAGDIINDNAINILDYNVFISCSIFSKDGGAACSKDASYKALSDLNDNGIVDQDDYNLLLREWIVQNGD